MLEEKYVQDNYIPVVDIGGYPMYPWIPPFNR